jgi:FtsP/CotA-like multicopper oxidase with cupredoxin domain
VAERFDVIIDFSKMAGKSIYIENRLIQLDGRGPVAPPNDLKPAGQGDLQLRFDVVLPPVADASADPAKVKKYYDLPDKTEPPRITRTFSFDRLNGMWSINAQFMSCEQKRFKVKQNSVEHWQLSNLSGDWQHPIHIHLEEYQLLHRNRLVPSAVEKSRKDVIRLQHNEKVNLFFRFRDFLGKYPMHCHNTVHEDHMMMLLWEVTPEGDGILVP